MNDIQFEYAANLKENELKYNLISERLNECTLYFTKNTLLQFFCTDLMCEVIDVSVAIQNNERGEYLYKKAIELCAGVDLMKEEYEKSGMSDKLSDLAKKITNKTRK